MTTDPERAALAALDELERLEKAMSAGRWERFGLIGRAGLPLVRRKGACGIRGGRLAEFVRPEDAAAVTALRNHAPALISLARRAERMEEAVVVLRDSGRLLAAHYKERVERAEAENKRLRQVLKQVKGAPTPRSRPMLRLTEEQRAELDQLRADRNSSDPARYKGAGTRFQMALDNYADILLAAHDDAVRMEEALGALGAIGNGYCFCSANRDPNKSEHEPECRGCRVALAASGGGEG